MKLRIKGNSLRLRLGRSEVDKLASVGHVEDGIAFGLLPTETLRYRVQSSDRDRIHADLHEGCITVWIPQETAAEWAKGEGVSLDGSQPVEDGDELTILIEKDFECINRKEPEDESDSFANPRNIAAC